MSTIEAPVVPASDDVADKSPAELLDLAIGLTAALSTAVALVDEIDVR